LTQIFLEEIYFTILAKNILLNILGNLDVLNIVASVNNCNRWHFSCNC